MRIQVSLLLVTVSFLTLAIKVQAGLIPFANWQPNCYGPVSTASYITPGSFTYTVPANVYSIQVAVLGAGGGGSWGDSYTGGGGGSGGYTEQRIAVIPGQVFNVVVGANMPCASGTAAGGGFSQFGTSLIACGGGGGAHPPSENGGNGGGACGGAGGTFSGDTGNGGAGGGWSGGNFGYNGSSGGIGSDSGGGGGGGGAPGRSGPGQAGFNHIGNFGGNGGAGSGGAVGGTGGVVDDGTAGATSTLPEGGAGGGGSYSSCGDAGPGGFGAGAGGGCNSCITGTSGFVYVEAFSNGFAPCGGVPLAFSFTDQTNVQTLDTVITSNAIVIGGSYGKLTATCGPGCTGISKNGGSFVPGPVTGFKNGDSIAIQLVSSALMNTAVTATVTLGPTTSAVWTVTTGTPPFIWIGLAGDNLWNTPGNWSSSQIPGVSDVAIFDSVNCSGAACNASINTSIAVDGVRLNSSYTGTVTQNSGQTINLGTAGWTQSNGTFLGSDSNITLTEGTFTQTGGTFTASTANLKLIAPSATSTFFNKTGGVFNPNTSNLYFAMAAAGCPGGSTYTFATDTALTFKDIRFAGGHPSSNNNCSWTVGSDSLTASGNMLFQRDQVTGTLALNGYSSVNGDLTIGAGTNGGNMYINMNGTINQNITQTAGAIKPNGLLNISKATGSVVLQSNLAFNSGSIQILSPSIFDTNSKTITGMTTYYLGSGATERHTTYGGITATGYSYITGCNSELYGNNGVNWSWGNSGCNITINKNPGVAANIGAATRIRGNFTIQSGSVTLNSSLRVDGNWIRTGGTFSGGTQTLTLGGTNQSILGSTTFYNLTKAVTAAATLTFEAGTSQVITNNLTLNGAAGNLLSLRSSASGTQWNIQSDTTTNVSYLNVQDSNNTGGPALPAGATSVDAGNNTNWTFP